MNSTEPTSDTVVGVCQRKLQELYPSAQIKVTGTDDDPNGSHVSDNYFLSSNLSSPNCRSR